MLRKKKTDDEFTKKVGLVMEAKPMTDEQREKFKKDWEKMSHGSRPEIKVLTPGLEVVPAKPKSRIRPAPRSRVSKRMK